MKYEEVMARLRQLSNPSKKDLEGMARFGINVENAWVISMPKLRMLAKEIKSSVIPAKAGTQRRKNGSLGLRPGMTGDELHELAQMVWYSGIHEARILAALIDVPELVTEKQMEKWVADFDSWDVCDQVCSNLFDKTEFAYNKAMEWSKRDEEYVKRAGFVIMAALATHDKEAPDEKFYLFIERIKEEATDERNFVKKAVNWALRGIGKSRTRNLYNMCLETAEEMSKMDSKSARWNARDTIRELKSDTIINRLKKIEEGR